MIEEQIYTQIRKFEQDKINLSNTEIDINNELKEQLFKEINNVEGFEELKYLDFEVWYKNLTQLQICFRFKNSELIEGEQLKHINEIMDNKFNCELGYISNNNERDLNFYYNEKLSKK